ncbi:MAG: urease accessory protein UreE [Pseudomonadota bacterium]
MLRATEVIGGSASGSPAAADTLCLTHGDRHLRRKVLTLESGEDVLVDLASAHRLRHGDRLLLDNGSAIEIAAAAEDLMQVTTSGAPSLAVLAWQIGNRHLPAQIDEDRILIERDHVIREMLEGLGAHVSNVTEAFHPQGGAYEHGHGLHAHSHGHGEGT